MHIKAYTTFKYTCIRNKLQDKYKVRLFVSLLKSIHVRFLI